ncbi:MAG: DeoR/GlpR transcriptional regulator [Clostridiales bacterium]|nr:DeoR/GlpR transcriptional regulator [Clostridiales bacterium]
MFAAERRKKIKEILLEYGHIDVNTLCSLLSVSVATVRRDLDTLEREGFLLKEHGGALLNESEVPPPGEVLLNLNADLYSAEKRQIGRVAANLVNEGEAVFIGSGSTCLCFARELPDMRVIVVTNSLHVAAVTASKHMVSTVLLGGDVELSDGLLASRGMYAEENIRNMFVDRAFLSAQGASIAVGYTMSSREQAALYKRVVERAAEVVMLMDYSKLGRRTLVPLAPLTAFRRVVSNNQIDEKYRAFYVENGIKLYTSP